MEIRNEAAVQNSEEVIKYNRNLKAANECNEQNIFLYH